MHQCVRIYTNMHECADHESCRWEKTTTFVRQLLQWFHCWKLSGRQHKNLFLISHASLRQGLYANWYMYRNEIAQAPQVAKWPSNTKQLQMIYKTSCHKQQEMLNKKNCNAEKQKDMSTLKNVLCPNHTKNDCSFTLNLSNHWIITQQCPTLE